MKKGFEITWQLTKRSYSIHAEVTAPLYDAMLRILESGVDLNLSEYMGSLIEKDIEVRGIKVEPMEALRYLPFLSKKGYLVTNTTPFNKIANYPNIEDILNEIKRQAFFIAIDADKIAKEIGNQRASNVVMLGAATPFIQISPEKIEDGIVHIFKKKGDDIVELNLKAFRAGRAFALENK